MKGITSSPWEYRYSVEGCSPVNLAVWNMPGLMYPVVLATPPHRSSRLYVSEDAETLLILLSLRALQKATGLPLSRVVHWTSISLHSRAATGSGERAYLYIKCEHCTPLKFTLGGSASSTLIWHAYCSQGRNV